MNRGVRTAGDLASNSGFRRKPELTASTVARDGADGVRGARLARSSPGMGEPRPLYTIVIDRVARWSERGGRYVNVASALVRDLDRRDRFLVLTCDTECRPLAEAPAPPGVTAADDVRRALSAIEPHGAHDPVMAVRAAFERGASGGKKLHVLYLGDGSATAGTSKRTHREGIVADAARASDGDRGRDRARAALMSAASRGRGGTWSATSAEPSSLATSAIAMTQGAVLRQPVIQASARSPRIFPLRSTASRRAAAALLARLEPARIRCACRRARGRGRRREIHQSFPLHARVSSRRERARTAGLWSARSAISCERKATRRRTNRSPLADHAWPAVHLMLVLENEAMFGPSASNEARRRRLGPAKRVAETANRSVDEHQLRTPRRASRASWPRLPPRRRGPQPAPRRPAEAEICRAGRSLDRPAARTVTALPRRFGEAPPIVARLRPR